MEQSEDLIVEVRRGPYIESVHRIAGCVVRPDGEVLWAAGNVDHPFPLRSLAKPFIAMELLRSGACEAYGLGDIEMALASGSHDGQPDHVAAVRHFLEKLGVPESALLCGPALSCGMVVGPPVANNCSGKHVAVLALCRRFSMAIEGYAAPDHPVMLHLIPTLLSEFGRRDIENTPLVTDGCGMPIFGASLREMAVAYAHLGTSQYDAAIRVRNAIASEPAYYGGWSGNLDTRIVSWSGGTIVGKIGAEGLHADAIVPSGLGLAVKVVDGNSRGLPPVIAQLFGEFANGLIESTHLDELRSAALRNASGQVTGDIYITQASWRYAR